MDIKRVSFATNFCHQARNFAPASLEIKRDEKEDSERDTFVKRLHTEASEEEKKKELKSLTPKGVTISDGLIDSFSKYEGDDYKFAALVVKNAAPARNGVYKISPGQEDRQSLIGLRPECPYFIKFQKTLSGKAPLA